MLTVFLINEPIENDSYQQNYSKNKKTKNTPLHFFSCPQPLITAFNKIKHGVLLWVNYDFPLIYSNSNYFRRAQSENCSHIYKKHVYFEN